MYISERFVQIEVIFFYLHFFIMYFLIWRILEAFKVYDDKCKNMYLDITSSLFLTIYGRIQQYKRVFEINNVNIFVFLHENHQSFTELRTLSHISVQLCKRNVYPLVNINGHLWLFYFMCIKVFPKLHWLKLWKTIGARFVCTRVHLWSWDVVRAISRAGLFQLPIQLTKQTLGIVIVQTYTTYLQ